METELHGEPRTLVVGLGATGLSCARFLASRSVEVAVTDSREQPPAVDRIREELPDVALFLGGFDQDVFARAERIVVSPGVSVQEGLIAAARQRGVEVIGDIELFARSVHAPVIAITGSNGKSTVTTLVGEMARQAGRQVRVGGNIGVPALDLINDVEPDLYVLELSSFQLETVTSLHCHAAVVLNISPDHMDRYASFGDYIGAKQRIYAGATVQVINRDDRPAAALAVGGGRQLSFGLDAPEGANFGIVETPSGPWIARDDEPWMAISQVCIAGRHNLSNALAALALGDAAGLDRQAMLQVLREFRGLPHRTQWVAERDGIAWYNDSKATNIGATLAAVRGLDGPLVLIAGGQGKGADFSELAAGLDERVKAVVLIGEAAAEIRQALDERIATRDADSMREAVGLASQLAQAGDLVLLSPACASFDMFDNYEHRGQVFMQAVRELLS
ncbi:MAG: UDP-N-acetylmuramoyl-L-alanine--D-glutamate ligase [Gammaproteobacteria bacterium]